MTYEEAKAKIKKLLMAEIDRLPSHYDAEIDEEVYSDTDEVNELLELNKIVSEAFHALEQTRWISVTERLPDNAQHKGAFRPKYQVMTKYGVTEGWYNPDYESWYILLWFMTKRFHETDIDLKRGDIPEVVKIPLKAEIVTAWMPLPEPVQVEVKGDEQE